jgi:DNA ligase-1
MLLADVVEVSRKVAATRSRLAKRDAIAALLRRADAADVEILVTYLAGELRQRRTGVGWASLRGLPDPAAEATLTLVEVDTEFERMGRLSGPGSTTERSRALAELMARATAAEQRFLRGLISGDVRQGALDAAVVDALAAATDIPLAALRRAVMLGGATAPVALAALTGGADAVAAFTLSVGRPIRPMLASRAPDMAAAFDKLGSGVEACLDTKLDGIRIQVHRDGDAIGIYTRSLDEISARLPDVAEVAGRLPARTFVLDGEAMTLDESGRPRPFQETASRTATRSGLSDEEAAVAVTPFFFDVLHLDGQDLLDLPLRDRLANLDGLVPTSYRIPRLITDDPAAGQDFFLDAVSNGQEGVVVKSLEAPYDAGRRGGAWIKVKPRHTLDLVVLAVEPGSGRRQGWLSNIHLGARDPETGGFVMLGKTFKGMTDEMLTWQTERFLELEESRTDWVVTLKPEQVVEIAFDGLQRSTRYPGGVALRFARVLRYRDDKTADEADTIDTVLALSPRV